MNIILNGKNTWIDKDIFTVADLLSLLDIPTLGTAVALNDKVVRRNDHSSTQITEGDRIEIVRAVAGG